MTYRIVIFIYALPLMRFHSSSSKRSSPADPFAFTSVIRDSVDTAEDISSSHAARKEQ